MSAHGQNDARGTARLLALTAQDCIRDPAVAVKGEVALNNAYRLLEAFRVNAFFGSEPHARQHPPRATQAISVLPRTARHLKEVRAALESAVGVVFQGKSKDEAIGSVENVLRKVAYPNDFGRPSQTDLSQAAQFFDEFIRVLNAG